MIFDLHWWLNLTPHQLDVIRTVASVVTGIFGGVLIPLLGWGIRLLRANRRDSEATRRNTEHHERVDGELRTVSVTEYARHAAEAGYEAASASESNGEATRDLALWVKGRGVHRHPTTELTNAAVPRQEQTHYE